MDIVHLPGLVDNETMAGVNSRFAEEIENNILRMQDITIPNDTKKATKLGMKVFSDKQCFNTQFAHVSSFSVFCPDRQAPLMPLSLNNNFPSTALFQSPIQVDSTSIEQNVSIKEYLNVAISIKNDCDFQHSNGKHIAWFPKETLQIVLSISSKLQLPSRNYFKVLITWTAILPVNFNRHCWESPIFMKS